MGRELDVFHTKTKPAAEKKAMTLIRQGFGAEITPVGKRTGALADGHRYIVRQLSSYRRPSKRRRIIY